MRLTLLVLSIFCFPSTHVGATCADQSLSCNPLPSCCSPGQFCNFNRGIPVCESGQIPLISGWVDKRCADPYLFDCSSVLSIGGFCCPIGTICFNSGDNNAVSCIDAYGTRSSGLPSNTVNYVPNSISNQGKVALNPPNAWQSTPTTLNCTTTANIQTAMTLNSTISFNYTGPSILIHTVQSPRGGVFSMEVDGFPMNDTIDTFNADGEACYPVQFPPFTKPPPGFGSRINHSITLTFTGSSKNAPNGTSNNVQFDTFAIPQFHVSPAAKFETTRGVYQTILLLLVFAWNTR